MMDAADRARRILRKAELKATPGRVAVMRALVEAGEAVSHSDISRLMPEGSGPNRVTLYRILDLFVDRGLAVRSSSPERVFLYCTGPGTGEKGHCHFHCLACGRTACLDPGVIGLDAGEVEARLEVEVLEMEIRVDGICAGCRRLGRRLGTAPDENGSEDKKASGDRNGA